MIPNSDKLSPYLHYFFTAYLPQQRGACFTPGSATNTPSSNSSAIGRAVSRLRPIPAWISSRCPGRSTSWPIWRRISATPLRRAIPVWRREPPRSPPSFPCSRLEKREVCLDSAGAVIEGNLWRRLVLPKRIDNWSLTSLQQRLVKTGGRLVKHARYYWLLLTESHLMTRRLCGAMLGRITRLPVPTG